MAYFEDYDTFTSPLEVPALFHLWCSISALAAVAQRKVWMDSGHFKVAPNMYIVLDAAPGFGKDTAMGIIKDTILPQVPEVVSKSDSITKEAICKVMKENIKPHQLLKPLRNGDVAISHSSLTIFATEMSVLIKRGDKDFVGFLCGLFNTTGNFQYTTKTKGEDFLVNPFLNILACTTPDWIARNIAEDVMEGGLSARTIFVVGTQKRRLNHAPRISTEGFLARDRVIARLKEIVFLGGEFTIDNSADDAYKAWYYPYYGTPPKNPKMQGFWERKKIFIQKLAMLISLSEKNDLVVTGTDIEKAISILDMTEPCIEAALAGVGRNELSPIGERIFAQIRSLKEISVADLMASNWNEVNAKDYQEIIQALVSQGRVTMFLKEHLKGQERIVVLL